MNHVKKFPSPDTLAEVRAYKDGQEPPLQDGWIQMSEDELRTWVAAEVAAGWKPFRPEPPVPDSIRSAQLRQWLIDHDLFAAVESLLADPARWPDEKTRLKAVTRWEYEVNVRRDDPMVVSLGAALGLTPSQIDAAFREAEAIP